MILSTFLKTRKYIFTSMKRTDQCKALSCWKCCICTDCLSTYCCTYFLPVQLLTYWSSSVLHFDTLLTVLVYCFFIGRIEVTSALCMSYRCFWILSSIHLMHISERSFSSLLICHVYVLKGLQEEDEGDQRQWKLNNDEDQDSGWVKS